MKIFPPIIFEMINQVAVVNMGKMIQVAPRVSAPPLLFFFRVKRNGSIKPGINSEPNK